MLLGFRRRDGGGHGLARIPIKARIGNRAARLVWRNHPQDHVIRTQFAICRRALFHTVNLNHAGVLRAIIHPRRPDVTNGTRRPQGPIIEALVEFLTLGVVRFFVLRLAAAAK